MKTIAMLLGPLVFSSFAWAGRIFAMLPKTSCEFKMSPVMLENSDMMKAGPIELDPQTCRQTCDAERSHYLRRPLMESKAFETSTLFISLVFR